MRIKRKNKNNRQVGEDRNLNPQRRNKSRPFSIKYERKQYSKNNPKYKYVKIWNILKKRRFFLLSEREIIQNRISFKQKRKMKFRRKYIDPRQWNVPNDHFSDVIAVIIEILILYDISNVSFKRSILSYPVPTYPTSTYSIYFYLAIHHPMLFQSWQSVHQTKYNSVNRANTLSSSISQNMYHLQKVQI